MSKPVLSPCVFCGSHKVKLFQRGASFGVTFVECMACKVEFRFAGAWDDVAAQWNVRMDSRGSPRRDDLHLAAQAYQRQIANELLRAYQTGALTITPRAAHRSLIKLLRQYGDMERLETL